MKRSLNRRTFIKSGLVSSLGVLGAGAVVSPSRAFGLSDTTSELVLEHTVIEVPNLPSEFTDYRIGFLSDIHIGVNVPEEWFAQALRMLTDLKIDILLLGGDYLAVNDSLISRSLALSRNKTLAKLPYSEHPTWIFNTIASMLSGVRPKDGIFGVYGNHDLWVSPKLCSDAFASSGATLLVNRTAEIKRGSSRLVLVGFDDYWNGVPQWPSSLPHAVDHNELRIALTHNPDHLASMLKHTPYRFTLGIAGHTHGGQIALPGMGPVFFNVSDPRFGVGLLKLPDGSISYTSRGLGVVEVPYRFNCPAEVTVLELRKA